MPFARRRVAREAENVGFPGDFLGGFTGEIFLLPPESRIGPPREQERPSPGGAGEGRKKRGNPLEQPALSVYYKLLVMGKSTPKHPSLAWSR